MTYTDMGTRVPEWMPQAMAGGVEHGARRTMRGLGNLYKFPKAPMRYWMYGIGIGIGMAFRPAWALVPFRKEIRSLPPQPIVTQHIPEQRAQLAALDLED